MSIIVTGSLAYDKIMDFPGRFKDHILPDKIHILNVCFVLDKFEEKFGGTAGNIAYSLKLLGADPVIFSAGGKDFARYEAYLKQARISTEYIHQDQAVHTALANIITDQDDNQITAFYPGAMNRGAKIDLPAKLANQAKLLLVSPSSKDEMGKRCLEAKRYKIPYFFDPGQQITALSGEELRFGALNSCLSVFNDYEWQVFQKKSSLAVADLTQLGVVVVVTRGQKGSDIYTKERVHNIGVAKPRDVVDPTGAGDAYRAGLAYGFLQNWDWWQTGQLAATVASFAVEKYGTQEHVFTLLDLNQRYQESFGAKCPLDRSGDDFEDKVEDISFR